MSFSSDILGFTKKAIKLHDKIKRGASLQLFSAIIVATPVAKGILRNNWFTAMKTPSLQKTEQPDASGQIAINRSKTAMARDVQDDIFFTNNLPYGPRIEFDGYSGKAPEGMVRVNVARWDKIVAGVARKLRG